MYIYPNVIEGTAFTTMELIEYVDKGPILTEMAYMSF